MRRLLAVLVGAGIAVGGGAAAWAAPNGTNRAAAKACLADAKAADPSADKAALKDAVKACLEAQGITVGHHQLTPEQQAKRDALKACLKGVKDANPGADRATLRAQAKSCFENAGITPGHVGARLAKLKECRESVMADHAAASRSELRQLVRECVRAG